MIRGFIKGFFIEIASLLALVVGIYGAIKFSYILGDYLQFDWKESYINLLAFAITFLVIIMVITLIGRGLTRIVEAVSLGTVNRLFGGVFGGLKIAIIIGILIAFFDRTSKSFFFIEEETAQKSIFYDPVKELGEFVFYLVLKHEQKPDGIADRRSRDYDDLYN